MSDREALDLYRELLIETRDFFKGKFRHPSPSRDLIARITETLEREEKARQYREAKIP